ncbi:MAG: double-strand break repair protein AddB [Rhodobacteraceae bacterium]|nr:double-strand break repair protein AddB [Paracoccaceae bacterium]
MFRPTDRPRLFALPPGADFPRRLAAGVLARMDGHPPEALARVVIHVNTRRMQRRLRALLSESGARLLPRITLVTDLARDVALPGVAPPVPPLRRRLELARLVDALLRAEPDLAPRSALHDLADSLARLGDEMQGEGVAPEALEALDVDRHAAHWARALRFLRLVQALPQGDAPDPEARQRRVVEALAARWRAAPPEHPVLVAGSTGSRGTTALLMEAVARLPQGAVVLPGFDFDMPPAVWDGMGPALEAEDHPQYRFRALLDRMELVPGDVRRWDDAPAPAPARNRLVSLALRPAPVTDQWMAEGARLSGLAEAAAGMTLIEAPSPRAEALAIALRLRKALGDGQVAALITPDRTLARQVTATLERWRITPDDSAGRPLALSAPGRFLRHVAALMAERLSAEALVTLLKHPLTHSAGGRAAHLLHTRDLELHIRRRGMAFPEAEALCAWGARGTAPDPARAAWADWLATTLPGSPDATPQPLEALVARHRALAEALARGAGAEGTGAEGTGAESTGAESTGAESTGELWRQAAGEAALALMDDLTREAPHGAAMTATDYAAFVAALMAAREVREPVTPDPRVMIWGTLEARVQGADLVILGGLNEGVWPAAPAPDPWLNRAMRADLRLLLPERQIGLAAHDFQQAVAAPEVVLTRAVRDAEAQTVPSRWLNRLVNLMEGLPAQGGTAALAGMRARGIQWLALARALEADFRHIPPGDRHPAPRPAPCPPVEVRPDELPVTAISRLIRDPYAVYARYVLGLRALDPLHPEPDALLRGTVLHKVLERFKALEDPGCDPRAALMATAAEVLEAEVPWAAARALWAARLARVADWFLALDADLPGTPVLTERSGRLALPGLGFILTARPDRIDEWPDGRLHILDYKTGNPPSSKQQEHFDKQLLLEALMAEAGGFAALGPRAVARVSYIGLGATPKVSDTDITPELNAETRAGLERLIAAYGQADQGYAARRALFSEREAGDYDHLARHGEWALQDAPVRLRVGGMP